jgi:hypothetical protein
MENSLKEQRGLEILDINNLDKFVTECIKLPSSEQNFNVEIFGECFAVEFIK